MSSPNAPKSFIEKAKQAAVTAAASAKAAAQVAAKQAERVKITQVTLSSAYLALGKDIYGAGRYRNEFGDLFTELDEIQAKMRLLKQTLPPPPSLAQKLTDRAKAAAGHAKDLAKGKALEMEANGVLRQLGETAYQKYGEQSGPAHLTQPIVQCHARIQALDVEIGQISASHTHGFLTPKRLLLGAGIVVAILLILFIGRLFTGGGATKELASKTTPFSSQENIPSEVTVAGGRASRPLGEMAGQLKRLNENLRNDVQSSRAAEEKAARHQAEVAQQVADHLKQQKASRDEEERQRKAMIDELMAQTQKMAQAEVESVQKEIRHPEMLLLSQAAKTSSLSHLRENVRWITFSPDGKLLIACGVASALYAVPSWREITPGDDLLQRIGSEPRGSVEKPRPVDMLQHTLSSAVKQGGLYEGGVFSPDGVFCATLSQSHAGGAWSAFKVLCTTNLKHCERFHKDIKRQWR